MYRYGKASKLRLETLHPSLQLICNELIGHMDVTVVSGYRGEEEQNRLKEEGKSKLKYPHSEHNIKPSKAVDIAPYDKVRRSLSTDKRSFYHMAGLVRGIAAGLGVKVRWGGCWANDNNFDENNFDDFYHFELIE